MKIYFQSLCFILAAGSISSCCKDKTLPPVIPSDPCLNNSTYFSQVYNQPLDTFKIKPDGYEAYQVTALSKYDFISLDFNPSNSHQICFTRVNTNDNSFQLVTFDICTGELKVIVPNAQYNCKWSKKDWIIFEGGNQIWKVKSNGDSLTQLTFGGGHHSRPIWSPNGSKFIYQKDSDPPYVIANEAGTTIDTVNLANANLYNWQTNNQIVVSLYNSTPNSEVSLYHLDTRTYQHIQTFSPYWAGNFRSYCTIGNLAWLGTKYIVASDMTHVYSINIESGQIVALKSGADNRNYELVAVNSNGKICFSRYDFTQDSIYADNLYYKAYLCLMNADGSNEKKILLPE